MTALQQTTAAALARRTEDLEAALRDRRIQRPQLSPHDGESASRIKDALLSVLGHDLRNPLNTISTAVEVLNRSEASAPVAISARRIIASQTRQLAGMVDRLLDAGHVLSSEVLLLTQPLELAGLVQRSAAQVHAEARAKTQTLQVRVDEAWVNGDSARVEQLIGQLLSNAIRHAPDGGHVDVELVLLGAEVRLCIRGGPGDGQAPAGRVVEPSVPNRSEPVRPESSPVLELALARRLVELHAGSLSTPGGEHGSAVEVRLPAIAAPFASAAPKRVLLVEDNVEALHSLQTMLELEGHQVCTSVDGVDGLNKLLQVAPDVAVIDVGLPGIDGYQLAKQGRSAGFVGTLVALTGHGHQRDAQAAVAAGFDSHMVKPADVDLLLRLIQR